MLRPRCGRSAPGGCCVLSIPGRHGAAAGVPVHVSVGWMPGVGRRGRRAHMSTCSAWEDGQVGVQRGRAVCAPTSSVEACAARPLRIPVDTRWCLPFCFGNSGGLRFHVAFRAPFHAFIERLHTLRVDVSPFPPVSLLVHPHSGLFRPVRRHEGFLGRIPFLRRPLSGCAAPEVAALRSMDMEWNGRALPESRWGHAGLALVHVA